MKLVNDFTKILNEFHKECVALEVNVLLRFTSSKSCLGRHLVLARSTTWGSARRRGLINKLTLTPAAP